MSVTQLQNNVSFGQQRTTINDNFTDLDTRVSDAQTVADSKYSKPVAGVPKSDLTSELQTSIDKADSAYQKSVTGIPKTDMSTSVQASLDKADSAYVKSVNGIPASDLEEWPTIDITADVTLTSANISNFTNKKWIFTDAFTVTIAETGLKLKAVFRPPLSGSATIQPDMSSSSLALSGLGINGSFASISRSILDGRVFSINYLKPNEYEINEASVNVSSLETQINDISSEYVKSVGTLSISGDVLTVPVTNQAGSTNKTVSLAAYVNPDLGTAENVAKIKNYALNNITNISGNKVLIIGASTEKGFNASSNVTSYVRNNGTVTVVVTSANSVILPGQMIYLSHDTDGAVSLFGEILTSSKSGNNYTITLADTRANIASKSNVQLTWFGMSSNHSTVMQLLNASVGGVLDVYNFASASTNTSKWLDTDRYTEIAKHGPYDYGYFGIGIGNDIQNVSQGSAQTIVNRVFQVMDLYSKIVRKGVLVSPLGSSSTTITPSTAPFTTLSLLENYLATEIPARYPNFEFVSTYKAAMDIANFGSVDTAEITNGRPNAELFETTSFIHYTPLGSEVIFKEVVPIFKRHMLPASRQSARSLPDNIFDNTIADPGGTEFNASGIRPWMGNTPTASVTVTGAGVIGTAPTGTTITATNLKVGMTASIGLQDNELGGRKVVLNFNDTVGFTTAPTVTWRYNGGTALIKDLLNNANFQGKECEFYVDFAFYGFNPGSLKFMDVSLMGVTSTGTTVICSPLSNMENDMGSNNGRLWERGFSGSPLKAPGLFKIPTATYTDAYIQVFFGGVNSTPMGPLTIEMANPRLIKKLTIA